MAAAASGKSMNAWCSDFLAVAARYELQLGLLASGFGGAEVREELERQNRELGAELLGTLGGGTKSHEPVMRPRVHDQGPIGYDANMIERSLIVKSGE